MRKKLFILVTAIFMLFVQRATHAIVSVDHPPPETIVLKLPNSGYANWKEIGRCVTEKEGLVERIPFNQTVQNWSELICIQYHDRSSWDTNVTCSIENVLDRIRETTLSSYPGNKVTWKIIEKNKNDIIYEWILHKPYKGIPPQHEVALGFLTEAGFHRIGVTRKNAEMGFDEREKWIKLLKESATVVAFEGADHTSEGLSMANWFKDSLDLGPLFHDWRVANTYVFDNGYVLVCRIPPSQTGVYTAIPAGTLGDAVLKPSRPLIGEL